jgi:hypothetical protein
MQIVSRYLVINKTVLVVDDIGSGVVTEYRKLYEKNLKAWRGIDNTFAFEIKNGDQKPVSILGTYIPVFKAFDEYKQEVINVLGTVTETASANKGQFTVTINQEALDNVEGQYLSYVVQLIPEDSTTTVLTYADTQYDALGTLEIREMQTSSDIGTSEFL